MQESTYYSRLMAATNEKATKLHNAAVKLSQFSVYQMSSIWPKINNNYRTLTVLALNLKEILMEAQWRQQEADRYKKN